jgi:hypothetical protein
MTTQACTPGTDHLNGNTITHLEIVFTLWKLKNLASDLVTRRHGLGLGTTRRHVQI